MQRQAISEPLSSMAAVHATEGNDVDAKLKRIQEQATKRQEREKRDSYLAAKGIVPGAATQLSLLFPDALPQDKLRAIPNDYARSSLFTVRNKTEPRRVLDNLSLFHLHESVSIVFTGIELRAEDDELVWMQILHYGKTVAFGEPFEFSIKELVRDLGWPKNGRYYDKARECISRLKANEVLARNNKAYGTSGAISLIQKYTAKNDAGGKPCHYQVWVDPNLVVLFAGGTFTGHEWDSYRKLSPVARRLTDYIQSHRSPFPLALEKFAQMCGSSSTATRSWKQTVKKACVEVVESGRIASFVEVKGDLIYAAK